MRAPIVKYFRHIFVLWLLYQIIFYITGCNTVATTNVSFQSNQIEFEQSDRVMILAPHPDDESLGAAGIIQRAKSLNLAVKVVFLTCGDNNQLSFLLYRKHPVLAPSAVRKMGEMRMNEALNAGAILGLRKDDIVFLGYPDFGTLHILLQYWATNSPPFRSMLTRAREVFYEGALRKGAPYRAQEILFDLKKLIQTFQPTFLFTSHPSDLNPDHQALYAFTHIALMELELEGKLPKKPKVLPYLVHFNKWPNPKKMIASLEASPPVPLARLNEWHVLTLSENEIEKKHQAIKAHRSQYAYSKTFMESFVRKTEIFGDLPSIQISEGSPPLEVASEEIDEEPPPAIENEKEKFVDIETCFIKEEKDVLIFTLSFRRPLVAEGTAYLYCFGISESKSFIAMPKIRVKIGVLNYDLFDGGRKIERSAIELKRNFKSIQVKIPIALLGNPDQLLVSTSTYLDELPLDWTGWRFIKLNNKKDIHQNN